MLEAIVIIIALGGLEIALWWADHKRQAELVKIALAISAIGLRLCVTDCRQKQRGQNRNDGNHHQQFNQCKAFTRPLRFHTGATVKHLLVFRLHTLKVDYDIRSSLSTR